MGIQKIYQLDLDKALQQTGCPICNIGLIAEQRHIRFFMHEYVNDGGKRKALHKAWGFCNLHAWRLKAFEEKVYEDGIKNAMLYEGMLQQALQAIQKLSVQLDSNVKSSPLMFRSKPKDRGEAFRPAGVCPICEVTREAELFHLEMLIKNLEDEKYQKIYGVSEGLCLPHFRAALDLPLDKKLLRKLCSLQIDRLAILSRELTGYIDKHGHNHNGEITKGEQDAWIKAIALVSGNHCPV